MMPAGAGAGRFETPEPPCEVITASALSGLGEGEAAQASAEHANTEAVADLTTHRLQEPLLAIFISLRDITPTLGLSNARTRVDQGCDQASDGCDARDERRCDPESSAVHRVGNTFCHCSRFVRRVDAAAGDCVG